MPKFVKIAPNPDYRPKDADDRKAFDQAKKKGAQNVAYVTATENIRNSGGMFQIVAQKAPAAEIPKPKLSDMSNEELKIMLLSLGIKTEKQMRRSEIITLIERKLDAVEVVDDE